MSRRRSIAAASIFAAVFVAGAAPAIADGQQITIERPAGQVVLNDLSVAGSDSLAVAVIDTRDDDPGWTVSVTVSSEDLTAKLSWEPSVERQTAAFTDSGGTVYVQDVTAGPKIVAAGGGGIQDAVLGSAPHGHGLGVAVLDAELTAVGHLGPATPTVTVTVV